jgi:fatty-acid desaturase
MFALKSVDLTLILCTFLFREFAGFVIGGVGGFGVTAGAHRFWCHRAYKANLPLRIILMLCYVTAGQVCH